MTELSHSTEKSRYLNAPKRPDFTLDQDWGSSSAAEQQRSRDGDEPHHDQDDEHRDHPDHELRQG